MTRQKKNTKRRKNYIRKNIIRHSSFVIRHSSLILMELLQELITIITPNKLKKINLITDLPEHSKLKQLYEGFHEKKWNNDEEAMKEIYGKEPKRDTYFKLKHDLVKKLLQVFPLINLVEGDAVEYRQARYECYTTYHSIVMLVHLCAVQVTPYELAEKIFDKCVKYEFTSLVMELADLLCHHHVIRNGDLKEANKYGDIAEHYGALRLAELKAKRYYDELMSYYSKDKSGKTFVPAKAKAYIEILDVLALELKVVSQRFMYHKKMLEVIYYMSQYNYLKTIESCESAISFFASQRFFSRANSRIFYYQLILCYAYLREYDKGFDRVEKCHSIIDEGTYGWFKVQELHLTLCIYAKQYQNAYQIYQSTTAHPKFIKHPAYQREVWTLNGAMLYLLQSLGKIQVEEGGVLKLRFQNFLNKVPTLQRDKKGLNFNIHLVQAFYLLLQKNNAAQSKYLDNMESFLRYARKYQNTLEQQRSRWMVILLDSVGKHGFHAKKIQQDPIVQNTLDQLANTPYDITDSNLDIEIVPFHVVFQYMLEVL